MDQHRLFSHLEFQDMVVVWTEVKGEAVAVFTANEETAEGRGEVEAGDRHGEGIVRILGIHRP
jgi:hypothetical protein